MLEAMATGVPLVTTRVGQAPEVATHEQDALLADVDDVEALAHAVLRLRDDATLRESLRTAARRTAVRYADERLDGRWAQLLEGFVRRAG